MPRHLITHQELEQEIADWLEHHPDHELREDVERTQMELASPGTWEVAKVTPDTDTGSHDQD